MSINSAMLAGASGMRANSSALAAISDNIANVNTVGYKRMRSDFIALLNSQNRQTTYNAGGVLASSAPLMGEQGSSHASSVATHLAVSGTASSSCAAAATTQLRAILTSTPARASSRLTPTATSRTRPTTSCRAGRLTRPAPSRRTRPTSTRSNRSASQASLAAPRRPRACRFRPTCNRRRPSRRRVSATYDATDRRQQHGVRRGDA